MGKGDKIVLIDPKEKRILVIVNQDAAKENLGDYVEIKGEVDASAKTLPVDSWKLLKKGRQVIRPKRATLAISARSPG